jgi:hypothetical protein
MSAHAFDAGYAASVASTIARILDDADATAVFGRGGGELDGMVRHARDLHGRLAAHAAIAPPDARARLARVTAVLGEGIERLSR